MKKYLKFTGKFTELIPNGWLFWKAYARNYRVYSKTSNGKKYGPTFNVWQHLGGYVEFEDYFSDSWLIFDLVQSGRYKTGAWYSNFCGKKDLLGYRFVINQHDNVIEDYNNLVNGEGVAWGLFNKVQSKQITKQEYNKLLDEYYDKYRSFVITQESVDFIKDMFVRGWVEIAEDKRKRG